METKTRSQKRKLNLLVEELDVKRRALAKAQAEYTEVKSRYDKHPEVVRQLASENEQLYLEQLRAWIETLELVADNNSHQDAITWLKTKASHLCKTPVKFDHGVADLRVQDEIEKHEEDPEMLREPVDVATYTTNEGLTVTIECDLMGESVKIQPTQEFEYDAKAFHDLSWFECLSKLKEQWHLALFLIRYKSKLLW